MYKVHKIEIDGFWLRLDASCQFYDGVNIIIGKNGSGKTTFMNILHSILTVDIIGLSENDFISAKVTLIKNKRKKTIQVTKTELEKYRFPTIEYKISQRKKRLRLIAVDDRRIPLSLRRRIIEESHEIKDELDKLVVVSSLSVYRLRNDDDYEVRDRHGARVISPVDYRLNRALRGLTKFQLELAEKAQDVSKKLQKDVLASILYSEDDAREQGWALDFDKKEEKDRLQSAYSQLHAINNITKKKIQFHVTSVDNAIKKLTDNNDKSSTRKFEIKALEALRKTRIIIDLSLKAKEATQVIYNQIEMFLKILSDFIEDKFFLFNSGQLTISNNHGDIDYVRLSSGEKQLIILMVEVLLQKQQPHIFLADEPELSLHIAWQRQIIPAIQKINPNGQVIVATHSPEIAAKYSDAIFDMEHLVNE